jgi:hypothetical protein
MFGSDVDDLWHLVITRMNEITDMLCTTTDVDLEYICRSATLRSTAHLQEIDPDLMGQQADRSLAV